MAATVRQERRWWTRQAVPRAHGTVNVGRRERAISAAAGAFLAILGSTRRSWAWRLVTLGGGALVLRAVTGHSLAYDLAGVTSAGLGEGAGIGIEGGVTISAPRDEVYRHWADLPALPAFLSRVVAVDPIGPDRTHWVLDTPVEDPLTFDAEVIEQRPGELIAWRTLPGSEIEHAGSLRFTDARNGRGTEVRLKLRFVPPGGAMGFAAAKSASARVARVAAEELRRVKEALEAGGTTVPQEQPSARIRREYSTVVPSPAPGGGTSALPFEEV